MKTLALIILLPLASYGQKWSPYLTHLEVERWSKLDSVARVVESRHPKFPHGLLRALSWRETKHQDTTRVEWIMFNVGSLHAGEVTDSARAFLKRHPELDLPLTIERLQRAASSGYVQVTGQNLRSLGYEGKYIQTMPVDSQFEYAFKLLEWNLHAYGTLPNALAAYNGGGKAVRTKRRTGSYPKAQRGYVTEVLTNIRRFTY